MTPSGIEPATFRLIAQCLKQLRRRATSCRKCNFTYNKVLCLTLLVTVYLIRVLRFCVLTAVLMNIRLFWYGTLCRRVNFEILRYLQHFEMGHFVRLQCQAIQQENKLQWKINTAKPTANNSKKKKKMMMGNRRKRNLLYEDV